MARLIWALFCEHQLTDDSGKNSYIGVFDGTTVAVRAQGDAVPLEEPLPNPVPTTPFVLAINLTADPGAPECMVRVKDSDGQEILPAISARLSDNSLGQHNWQLRFAGGIPVVASGIYAFEIYAGGERIGEAQLPVTLDLG